MAMELTPQEQRGVDIESFYTPQEMAVRLANMKQKLNLVQSFFKEIMLPGQDYGIIPGTDKPTLLKPGSEKLCEFYGYSITVKDREENADKETGYYRAIVTVALAHRRTGVVVAEGVGEANTMEGRYRWRWVPDWKLPKGIDKSNLHCEERKSKKGEKYLMYRMENEDPWALWNTVLKMAKKRALVDAALSATRSSGLFTQDMEDLQEWAEEGQVIDAEIVTPPTIKAEEPKPKTTPKKQAPPASKQRTPEQQAQASQQPAGAKELTEEQKKYLAELKRIGDTYKAQGLTEEEIIAEACRVTNTATWKEAIKLLAGKLQDFEGGLASLALMKQFDADKEEAKNLQTAPLPEEDPATREFNDL